MRVRPPTEVRNVLTAYLWPMDGDHRRWWARHWETVVYDLTPPVVLLALGLLDVYTGIFSVAVGYAPPVTAVVPGALACVALVFRRRYPLIVLLTILALVFVPPLLNPTSLTYWDEFAVWLGALYSCARHRPLRWALVGLALSAVAMVALPWEFAELRDPGAIGTNAFLVVAAFLLGRLTRSWAAYRRRVERASAERAVAEERARLRERTRIARDLHDVISHTITVIVVQAGGARLAGARDPDVALDALQRIERLGQDSLAELRSLLAVLGDESADAAPTAPPPLLADVPAMCEQMRSLGLPVQLHLDESVEQISDGVQLVGYRVVQEGLTNVLKHAGAVETDVSIRRGPEGMLHIEVDSAPAGAPASAAPSVPSGGRGLSGMRERVAAMGGTLAAASRPDGGFVISASLPVAPVGERTT